MKEYNMLKKSLLALAASLVSVSAANAATVYNNEGTSLSLGGRLQGNVNSVFADKYFDETESHKVKLQGAARLNVDAKTRIYDGVNAVAFGEWEVASESSENGKFDTRYATVGIETDHFGSVKFGQTESAIYNTLSVTDMFEDVGFAANTFGDYADGGRQEGQIIYAIDGLNGFNFATSFQSAGLDGVESGAAVSLGYTFNEEVFPVYLSAGYDTYDLDYVHGIDQNPAEDEASLTKYLSKDSFAFGLSLGDLDDGFYGAAAYQLSKYARHDNYRLGNTNSYEVVAGYGISGWQFLLGYENRQIGGMTVVNDINAEIKYNFNEQFLVYSDASFATSKHTDNKTLPEKTRFKDNNHNWFTAGVQYNF